MRGRQHYADAAAADTPPGEIISLWHSYNWVNWVKWERAMLPGNYRSKQFRLKPHYLV